MAVMLMRERLRAMGLYGGRGESVQTEDAATEQVPKPDEDVDHLRDGNDDDDDDDTASTISANEEDETRHPSNTCGIFPPNPPSPATQLKAQKLNVLLPNIEESTKKASHPFNTQNVHVMPAEQLREQISHCRESFKYDMSLICLLVDMILRYTRYISYRFFENRIFLEASVKAAEAYSKLAELRSSINGLSNDAANCTLTEAEVIQKEAEDVLQDFERSFSTLALRSSVSSMDENEQSCIGNTSSSGIARTNMSSFFAALAGGRDSQVGLSVAYT